VRITGKNEIAQSGDAGAYRKGVSQETGILNTSVFK
jgi:hypothetical protein